MARISAKFTINGSSSSARGYDAANGATITLALETSPAPDVYSVKYSVYAPGDPASPLASLDAPVLTLSPSNGVPLTPTGTVTFALPGSGAHSYIVRCVVNSGVEAATGQVIPEWTHERIVCVRTGGGVRKMVPGEATQYSGRGWSDEQNRELDIVGGGMNATELRSVSIDAAAPALGDVLRFDGTKWEPGDPDYLNLPSGLRFVAAYQSPGLSQVAIAGVGAHGVEMLVKAQDASGGYGAALTLEAGAGPLGNAPIVLNSDWIVLRSQDATTWWGFFNSTGFNLIDVNKILFSMQGGAPLIQQLPRTDNAACGVMTFTGQAPWADATGDNRIAGGFAFGIPGSVGGAASGAFRVYQAGTLKFHVDGSTFGFLGSAAAKQTISGSRDASGSVLGSLLTALAGHGILTDSTTIDPSTTDTIVDSGGLTVGGAEVSEKAALLFDGKLPAPGVGDLVMHVLIDVWCYVDAAGVDVEDYSTYTAQCTFVRVGGGWGDTHSQPQAILGNLPWGDAANPPAIGLVEQLADDSFAPIVFVRKGARDATHRVAWRARARWIPLPLPTPSAAVTLHPNT